MAITSYRARTRTPAAALLCLVLAAPALTACGEPPALCQDMDALSASIENLRSLNTGENALSAASSELTKIESDLEKLRADAAAEFATQIAAVQSAKDGLRASVRAAAEAPTTTTLSAVRDDVGALRLAVDGLKAALSASC